MRSAAWIQTQAVFLVTNFLKERKYLSIFGKIKYMD